MKIKLGVLRKIIKEELKKIKEIKLLHNEPMALGGAGFHTGPESKLPVIEDLIDLYDEKQDIPAGELMDWIRTSGLKVTDLPPETVVPNYQFVDGTLYGLDVKGNQALVVKMVRPGTYAAVGKKVSPSALAARALYN
jgi:hypothetical protein